MGMSFLQKLLTRVVPFAVTIFAGISLLMDVFTKSEQLFNKPTLLVLAIVSICFPFILGYYIKRKSIVWIFDGKQKGMVKSLWPYSHLLGLIFGLFWIVAFLKPQSAVEVKEKIKKEQEQATLQLIQDLKRSQLKIAGFFSNNNTFVDSTWKPMSISKRNIQGRPMIEDFYSTLHTFFDTVDYKFTTPMEMPEKIVVDRIELIANDEGITSFRFHPQKDRRPLRVDYTKFGVYFTANFFNEFEALKQVANLNILPAFHD
jgi:hypothetical protein